jgi:hypothetical protein
MNRPDLEWGPAHLRDERDDLLAERPDDN